MPQDLAALLVEEGAVSQADMDRATARQAQQGGALDTSLLELGLIGEGHLLSFLARAADLPPAPVAALKEIDPRARRVFPAKVAERHRLAPFALDGRELSVVAVHPVDGAVVDEIGFMLSLTLVPHVAPEWRVQELIQRLYGGQLPVRLARLAEAAPTGTEQPPEPAPPATSSVEDAFFAAGEAAAAPVEPPPSAEPQPEPGPPPVAPPEAPPAPEPPRPPVSVAAPLPAPEAEPDQPPSGSESDETSFGAVESARRAPGGFGRDDAEPAEPLLFALEQAFDLYDALWAEPAAEPPGAKPPEGEAATEAATAGAPAEAAAEPAAAIVEGQEQAGESSEPGEPEGPPPVLDRSAPPRWSIDDALVALSTTTHRDEVVVTALRFARDFFEFSALFAVTRDAVVGHDALGIQEDARSHARATALYAADPGVVKTVLETRAPYLGPVELDAVGTSNVLEGLWRGKPRTVLLYPILVHDRPVAVLYADNGEAPVSARRLGDLLLFLSTVGATFERIIRARKKRRPRGARAPAPPSAEPPGPPAEAAPPEPTPDWMAPPPDGPAAEAAPEAPPAPSEPAAPDPLPAAVPPPVAAAPEAEPTPPGSPSPPAAVEAAMAALLAGARGSTDGVAGIVDLVLDGRTEVAAAAREALVSHRGDAAIKPLPERLRRALLSGVGDRPILAARALGALRDVESIPILIQSLEGATPETSEAAAAALAQITLQRLGPSAQRWLRWWKENRGRSRAEWLFAALTSEDRELRLAASGELRSAGEPPVRYTADLSAAEREGAARAWWTWWSRQGIRL